jgi:hypothetical protein
MLIIPSGVKIHPASSLLALASLDLACRDHSRLFCIVHQHRFDDSSLQWLGISDLIAEPEGPSFISRTVTQPPCGPALVVTQGPPLPKTHVRICERLGLKLLGSTRHIQTFPKIKMIRCRN